MLIRCKQAFGYRVPGDTQEIPDGSVFDTFYFEEVIKEKPVKKEPEKKPESVPAKTVEIEKEG